MNVAKIKKFAPILSGLIIISLTSSKAYAGENMIELEGLVYLLLNENEAQVTSASQGESYNIPERITVESRRYDVTSIGPKAFYSNQALISIKLPANLCFIEDKAFAKCTNLKEINFPESLNRIGNYAFLECEHLAQTLSFDSDVILEDGCFSYCKSIESADLSLIHNLGIQAFEGCSALKTIKFNRSLKEIPDYSFRGCTMLENVDLPSSITRIGDYAFCDNKNLTILTIPRNVSEIGEGSFSNCTRIAQVKFECKDAAIAERAFEGLTSLRNLYTQGISNIGSAAFAGCSSLEWIEIGESTESLSNKVFSSCPGLKTIYSHPTWTPSIRFDTFDEYTKIEANLLVEKSALNNYRLAPDWCDFLHILPTEVFPLSIFEITEDASIEVVDISEEIMRVKCDTPVQLYHSNGISISGKKISEGIYEFKAFPGLSILRSTYGSKKILLQD